MENKKLKIVPISTKNDNSKSVSAKQMLLETIEAIDKGKWVNPDALILLLERKDGGYHTGWFMAGLSSSEAVALLEVAKIRFLGTMNYVHSDDNVKK